MENTSTSLRRSRSMLVRKSNPFNLTETDTMKRRVSLPARPSGNGWAVRLWDNLYKSQEQTPKQNNLQESVKQLLREGQSLSSILKKVEFVLEESKPSVPVGKTKVEKTDSSEKQTTQLKSIEESKEGAKEIFYSATDFITDQIPAKTEKTLVKTKVSRCVSQRVVNYLLKMVVGKNLKAQNRKKTKKVKSYPKSQIQTQKQIRQAWIPLQEVF